MKSPIGRIYDLYALLRHRPSCLIDSTGIPAAAAVVAAPIRRL